MSSGLSLHVGDDLDSLCRELATLLKQSPGAVLEPTWIVVPSASLRQWLDARLSTMWATSSATSRDGVAANIRYLFPEEFVRTVESAALSEVGMSRVTWDVTTVTLAQMARLTPRPSYESARRQGEAIDLLMRWREQELRDETPSTPGAKEANAIYRELVTFRPSPLAQRDAVRDALLTQLPAALPSRVFLFALASIPGGSQFVQLLSSLASHCEVQLLWPTPSIDAARRGPTDNGDDVDTTLDTWKRESRESLQLWNSVPAKWNFLSPHDVVAGSLGALQRQLIGTGSLDAINNDASVRVISCVGHSRQVEVLRDIILDAVSEGIEPHDILVLSPDPSTFSNDLERHWNYERSDELVLPRLAYEMTDSDSSRFSTKLRLSLALLHLVGNYVTRAHIEEICSYSSVRSALQLDTEQLDRLWTLAAAAPVTFGVSPEQRSAHDVFGTSPKHTRVDAGTWQRLADRVVSAAIDPCENPEAAIAVASDLTLLARLYPLLRLLEETAPFRFQSTLEPLSVWLDRLETWMSTMSDRDDDGSFDRATVTARGWTSRTSLADDVDAPLSFDEFCLLWNDLASTSVQQRVFGRRGVVVAPLTSLQFAPYAMVCILGFDEDLLPSASWSNSVLGARRAGDPEPRNAILASALAASLSARQRLVVTYSGKDESTGREIERAIALDEWLDVLDRSIANFHVETSSRHSFAVPEDDEHAIVTTFDRRTLVGSPTPILLPSSPDEPSVSREDIEQFLSAPVNFYIRRTLAAQIPQEPSADLTVPPISVSALHRSALQRAYLEQLATVLSSEFALGHEIPLFSHFDHEASADCEGLDCAWLHVHTSLLRNTILLSESATAAVPPQLWHHRLGLPLLNLAAYNYALDQSDIGDFEHETDVHSSLSLSSELSVTRVSSGQSSNSSLRWGRGDDGSLVATSLVARTKSDREPRHLLRLVAQLLLQKIDFPDDDVSVMTYFLPDRATAYARKTGDVLANDFPRNPFIRLRYAATSLQARADLSILVELLRRSRSEVVPLFSTTSIAFVRYGHKEARAAWQTGFSQPGEANQIAHRLLFPANYDDLVALSSTGEAPLANELRRALANVEVCEMNQSRRSPARRWRQSHPTLWSGIEVTDSYEPLIAKNAANS